MELSANSGTGMRRWLLIRRSTYDLSDLPFCLAYRPQDTPVEELVRVCEVRWTVEECFAQAKAELGLDQYEVRRWEA
jgi:SRSO17 transposase